MYVIKMKTLIYYFAIFAISLASIGIISLYSQQHNPDAVIETSQEAISENEKDVLKITIHTIRRQ